MSSKEARINHNITARQIRLINEEGHNVGVVSTSEALKMADAASLDLVEISPNVEPPVCKIMDYGKYRYEMQKKEREAHKKQKIVIVKEIKLRPVTDTHDFEIKLNQAEKFLKEGDKVKVTLSFKGREMDHRELGYVKMDRIKERFAETAKIELEPRMEGKHIIMIMAPRA